MVKIVYRSEVPSKTMASSHLLNESTLATLDDERFSPRFASRLKDCIRTIAQDLGNGLRGRDPEDMIKAKLLVEQLMEMIGRSEDLDWMVRVVFRDGDLEKFQEWLTRECERRAPRPQARKLPQTDFKLDVALSVAQVFFFYGRKLTVSDSTVYGSMSDFVFAVEVALRALGRKRGDIKRLCIKARKITQERGPVASASQDAPICDDDDIL